MSIDVPMRIVVLVALVFVAAAAGFSLLVLGHGTSEPTTAPTHGARPTRPATKLAHPTRPRVTTPKLAPNLPRPIAYALARHPSVVVAVYGRATGDRESLAEARAGAAIAHKSFIALDMTKQKYAEAMATFGGTLSEPTVFVVKRPGTIVRMLQGFQDRQVVAQAAHDVR